MAKSINSCPGFLGFIIHCDKHGKKVGESHPNLYGGQRTRLEDKKKR